MSDIEKIKAYKSIIEGANHLYYNSSDLQLSDELYDQFMDALIELEKKEGGEHSSPSQIIGSDLNNKFEKVKHEYKMYSLNKTYNVEEFLNNLNRRCDEIYITNPELKKNNTIEGGTIISLEPKIDGMAIIAKYQKGKLKQVLSRGDGVIGNDITENARTIRNLPQEIFSYEDLINKSFKSDTIYLKGEVYIPLKFKNEYGNLRSAVSGAMKLKNPMDSIKIPKYCNFYEIIPNGSFTSETSMFTYYPVYSTFPLIVSVYKSSLDTRGIKSYIERINEVPLCYGIDGVVLKVVNFGLREKLGWTKKHPNWAIAIKPKNKEAVSEVINIETSVSKKGKRTPILIIKPTKLKDSIITKVNMHNENLFKKNNIEIGDKIKIELAGGIIPKFIKKILD